MNEVLLYLKNLFIQTLEALITSYQHNWKVLLFAILLAVALTTYVNSEKLSQILFKKKKISIIACVLFGAFTPLCACGTTAVLIGMLTTTLPWSPIMAFLTSSPLMSPDGFVLISGVIGLKFAIALTVASVFIGLGAGFITGIIEKKTDFFNNQSRFTGKGKEAGCGCKKPIPVSDCGCNISSVSECACSEVTEKDNCSCGTVKEKNDCSCAGAAEADSCSCKDEFQNNKCSCDNSQQINDNINDMAEERSVLNQNSILTFKKIANKKIKNNKIASKKSCSCNTMIYKSNCSCSSNDSASGENVNFLDLTEQQSEYNETIITKLITKFKLKKFIKEFYNLGLKQILFFYSIFVCIGYIVNYLVPASIISVLFEANSFYAVPLASLIGLPLYITTDSGIPIIQSMIQSGASEGAMLAFMITGSATSAWVIAGLTTFMKKRAITLYVAFVLFGGIISGYLLDLVGIFVK